VDVGESSVRRLRGGVRRAVRDGGPDEWVSEPDLSRLAGCEPSLFGGSEVVGADGPTLDPPGGVERRVEPAALVQGGGEQQGPRRGGQLRDPAGERSGEALGDRKWSPADAAVPAVVLERPRKLHESQRVASGLGHDTGADHGREVR
jgi:hypothetical protein